MQPDCRQTWKPNWQLDLKNTLSPRFHGNDPTIRQQAGCYWLAENWPSGPATLRICKVAGGIELSAWGAGAESAINQAPMLLGASDEVASFNPKHQLVRQLWKQFPNWRLCRTERVFSSLLPIILSQKVTGKEAYTSYRNLVQNFGTTAPKPKEAPPLFLPLTPSQVAAIPAWEWIKYGVTSERFQTIMRMLAKAESLEKLASSSPEELDAGLRSIPGIGVWTSAEVRARVLGDADAVSFGDYHIAKNIGYWLTGKMTNDQELAELLKPEKPHRQRVQRLIEIAGLGAPRRGPRFQLPTHLP